MNFITPYIHALKKLKKSYFFSPFLLLIYAVYGYRIVDRVTTFFKYSDKGFSDYIILIITFAIAYSIVFLQILTYTHSSYFIQTSKFYTKIFKGTKNVLGSGVFSYFSIGKNIPEDVYVKDARTGRSFRVSQGYKSKHDRVSNARTNYLIFIVSKFIIIDFMLRFAVHVLTFTFSPIIFLFAVPTLRKHDTLVSLEY